MFRFRGNISLFMKKVFCVERFSAEIICCCVVESNDKVIHLVLLDF